jgi:hypothetical protein
MQVLLLHFNQPLISRQKNDVFRRFSGGGPDPPKTRFFGFFGFPATPPVFHEIGTAGRPDDRTPLYHSFCFRQVFLEHKRLGADMRLGAQVLADMRTQ